MRKKQNTKFSIIDLAIILFCLAGTIALGAAFRNEYNRTLVKLNEEPVGIITFKKNTAQRKFIDREIWDRLKQAAPIYNGDTIRTIEQSEAIVIFNDQVTHLTLDEGTLIQIFFNDHEGGQINFYSGNLEVVSGSNGITISSGGTEILLSGQASLMKNEEGLGLSVLGGQASFNGKEIEAGEIIVFDGSGNAKERPVIAMTSFGASARVLGTSGAPGEPGSVPVVFSWNSSYFGPDSYVVVEVAEDRGFSRIVASRDVIGDSSVSVPLGNGNYWWRAFPANDGSREPNGSFYPSGIVEVIPVMPTNLLSPAPGSEITYSDMSRVSLSWSASEGAASYLVEISANANMSAPLVSRRVERNSVAQTGLESGRWFWRVTPVFPARYTGSGTPSAVSDFSVVRGVLIPAEPVLTFPANNGTLSLDTGGRRLLWKHDPLAASWDVELSDNPNMANPFVKQSVVSNYFSLPHDVLQEGKTWYWRVSAFGGERGAAKGASPIVSATRSFTVRSGGRLPAVSPPPVPLNVAEHLPPAVTEPFHVAEIQQTVFALPEEPPARRETAAPEPVLEEERAPPQSPPVDQPPEPEPMPVPAVQQTPEPQPPEEEQPERRSRQALPPPGMMSGNLFRLASPNQRTVSETKPVMGLVFTMGQLENTKSIEFSWRGEASEYRFAIFRSDGVPILPPTTVTGFSYLLTNPADILEKGDYVWQVFERNKQGAWGLPSSSSSFHIEE